jgi:hypothetical protein
MPDIREQWLETREGALLNQQHVTKITPSSEGLTMTMTTGETHVLASPLQPPQRSQAATPPPTTRFRASARRRMKRPPSRRGAQTARRDQQHADGDASGLAGRQAAVIRASAAAGAEDRAVGWGEGPGYALSQSTSMGTFSYRYRRPF